MNRSMQLKESVEMYNVKVKLCLIYILVFPFSNQHKTYTKNLKSEVVVCMKMLYM